MSTGLIPAALLLAASAQATSPAAAPGQQDQTIVVTGRPGAAPPERTFVEALATPSRNRQLARFEEPVCPVSFGLGDEDAVRFARRLRRVAAAAGLRVADNRCRPNLVLFVVPSRARAIASWRVRRPDYFDGLSPSEIGALEHGDGPVAAWQIVHTRGEGRRTVGVSDSNMYTYLVVPEATPYRIGSQIQLEFGAAFVLIEASAIGDATITQLTDYVVMRALARTDPQAAMVQPLPTILSLFARGADAPLSVTEWDLRFLTALYATDIAFDANSQQRAMARDMIRARSGD